MAYLVLARKYRPETFGEMIGQEHVTRTISNALKEDRVHHAYLFCGVRGLGKTTAARILAKCLVCEKGPTIEPCNACEQCVAVNEGRSVDVIEIDGASNNKVEHVRALREQVNYLPQTARRKVYIIDEVHMLTDSAFNALLKTLEEPPPHVTFIFATTDPHKVLPTILSRVSRLDFRRVRTPELIDYLRSLLAKEGIEAEDEALHLVAQASEGSVRDALTLLDKVIAFTGDQQRLEASEVRVILGHADRFAVADLLDAVFARDARATIARFDEITRTGSDLLQLAIGILRHLRDLAVLHTCRSRDVLVEVSDGLYERLEEQVEATDAPTVAQAFDRFSRVLEGLETSRVPRLAVEMGLLDLVNAEPLIPMGDLVDRLRDLSAGGGPRGGRGPAGGGSRARTAPQPKRATPAKLGSRTSAAPMETDDAATAAPTNPNPGPNPNPDPDPNPNPTKARPAAGAASGSTPAPEPASTPSSAPTPSPSPAASGTSTPPIAPVPQSALAKELWGMVSGSLGASPDEVDATSNGHEHASRDFSLTPPTEPVAVEPAEVEAAPSQEACPSSRCTPREPIAWRELEPIAAWEALLERVRGEDDFLFAVLGELGLSRLGDGTLELAAPRSSFAREQLDEHPQLRASLTHFMEEYFGEALELKLLDATPGMPDLPSLVLLEEARRAQRQADVEARVRQNGRIRALLSAFDGEVRSVRPLDPSADGPG